MLSRGTDIKLSEEAKNVGGLFIIKIGFIPTTKYDKQCDGRSGRQGDPGRVEHFLSMDCEPFSSIFREAGNRIIAHYIYEVVGEFCYNSQVDGMIWHIQDNQRHSAFEGRMNLWRYDLVIHGQRYEYFVFRDKLMNYMDSGEDFTPIIQNIICFYCNKLGKNYSFEFQCSFDELKNTILTNCGKIKNLVYRVFDIFDKNWYVHFGKLEDLKKV